jgi:ABC-type dipeptide/oligopeptide/nickel transport system ATPase component
MKAFDRFLMKNDNVARIGKSETNLIQQLFVPPHIANQFHFLYTTFIIQDAIQEVNITDKVRKKITETLLLAKYDEIPFNLFDEALDEIINLLYGGIFKRFIANHEKLVSEVSKVKIGRTKSIFPSIKLDEAPGVLKSAKRRTMHILPTRINLETSKLMR